MRRFIKSFGYAFDGIIISVHCGKNIKIQLLIAAITFIIGLYFHINYNEWIAILICTSVVLGMELMNTAIEKLADHICSSVNPNIKIVKDISAGAVLITSLFSFCTGLIIFLPKVYLLFKHFIK